MQIVPIKTVNGGMGVLLERINHPQDLKSLSLEQLDKLAEEIRQFLIDKLSITGGHLAPNLGVVELTLALHYFFDSPKDKFIFDVGHQSYVHKMITGRRERFDTLKQYKGLSGYIKRTESEHDIWEAGHSSTSLSAAMGMCIARDLKGEKHKIIAVIGDGALTGGMALEALNHIGHERKNLIVILNDNDMSIAPNVGALHNYFSRLRTDQHYVSFKEDLEKFLKKIPAIGGTLAKTAEKLKDSLKYLFVKGVLFEELGYTYIGPIDGHSTSSLMESLQIAAKTEGPVLLHIHTIKGKGYAPAEENAYKWHGISPYKIESGELIKKSGPPSYTSIFSKTLIEIAKSDPRIVAITAAMPDGTGLDKFGKQYPDRMFDVGIAEQHATTMAAGLAMAGMKPVFAVYSTFLQRAYDQMIHDVCRQNLNVVFAVDRAGLVGADGETHQGVFDIGYLRHVPNMVMMMPKDENELRHMIHTSIEYKDGPIAVRYPRGNGRGVDIHEPLKLLPIGKAEILREGKGVAILALGTMVEMAEKACDRLQQEGMTPMLVNARFVKPLDTELLQRFAEEGYQIITVEEGQTAAGFGSAIMEHYGNNKITNVPVYPIGLPDQFIEHGSINELREEVDLTVERIVTEVSIRMPRKKQRMGI
jgi:1-deoxy-D-xylulose-5-phosphate synthase